MKFPVSPHIVPVHFPPISEVKEWLQSRHGGGPELIDLCQAVPDYAPHPDMTAFLTGIMDDPLLSKYSPDEGLPEVRAALCSYYEGKYSAKITPANLCMTIGASQAFWLAIVTLCQAGDEVVVQAPYYFDHAMALDMLGLCGVYAPYDGASGGLPSPAVIDSLITDKTRAILLVTPSNPTGAISPPEIIAELYALARKRGIALILDETYNEFIPGGIRPHDLFTNPQWGDHFIQITSFGKTFALTGYRAGMLVASEPFIRHALKVQDTMAVCQPRITQHAVKYCVENLQEWVSANREMMTRRHDLFRCEFLKPGNRFQLSASGAFFAWVQHPFNGMTGRQIARRLLDEAGVICLPGEVFGAGFENYLRLAFGNIHEDLIPEAVRRFREMMT